MSKLEVTPGIFSGRLAQRKANKVNEALFNGLLELTHMHHTIADLGSGMGKYVRRFREAGKDAYGFDGIHNVETLSGGLVYQQDLTKRFGFNDITDKIGFVDVAICIEVGEHIPEKHIQTFLDNICHVSRHMLIISWAVPGQRGSGHISCHTPEWVAAQVYSRHWAIDEGVTMKARKICGRGFRNKILVFREEEFR